MLGRPLEPAGFGEDEPAGSRRSQLCEGAGDRLRPFGEQHPGDVEFPAVAEAVAGSLPGGNDALGG